MSGTYSGSRSTPVTLAANPATVTGTISVASGIAVTGPSGTAWTLSNLGFIAAANNIGVSLASGGTVTNQSTGSISGYGGVEIYGAAGTVTNAGTISNTGGIHVAGILLAAGGSVSNTGTIIQTNSTTAAGIALLAGGTATNSGQITASNAGIVGTYSGSILSSVLVNSGTIVTTGTKGSAIDLTGGTLTNTSTGVISAAHSGVNLTNAAGVNDGSIQSSATSNSAVGLISSTLTNAGTIGDTASFSSAVYLGAGTSRLIVDPGAVFNGSVNSNTAANNTLELASGASQGTISGSFSGFATVAVDASASWNFSNTAAVVGTALTDAGTLDSGIGLGPVTLLSGGSLINEATGTIAASTTAVSGAGFVHNLGFIVGNGASGVGIDLTSPETVINDGTISGGGGTAIIFGGTGGGSNINRLIENAGAGLSGIVTAASGVNVLELAGSAGVTGALSNLATNFVNFNTISIDANASWGFGGTDAIGVLLSNLGTLSAQGSITGAGAIDNAGILNSAGAVGSATVSVATVVNTGTISAVGSGAPLTIGSTISGAGQIVVGSNGTLALDGAVAASQAVSFVSTGSPVLEIGTVGSFAGTISGFQSGDTIDFTGVSFTGSTVSFSAGALTVSSGGTPLGTIAFTGSLSNSSFVTGSSTGYLTVTTNTVACFHVGTAIATSGGEVAVERLAAGQCVLTAAGEVREIVWIGQRRIDVRRHPEPVRAWPVRVEAHAFAPGIPRRTLLLSPDHAVFVDGVLIPIRYLINGASIAQEPRDRVQYFHIELAAHDVLLAEGLACESYLDTGNRADFEAAPAMTLHPDFSTARWDTDACAALHMDGPVVAAVRARLCARLPALGYAASEAPELSLRAGPRILRPARQRGRLWQFLLPAGTGPVRLDSACGIATSFDHGSADLRWQGVAIGGIVLDGRAIALDDPMLGAGFFELERGSGACWRATSGAAHLALPPAGTVRTLELMLHRAMRRWVPAAMPRHARAG